MSRYSMTLAVFCLILKQIDAEDLNNYTSKSKNFPNRNIYINSNGINGTNLFYAVCNNMKNNNEIKCQIRRLANNEHPERSCYVSVQYQNPVAYHTFMHAAVYHLNENNALFLWSGTNVKMSKTFTKYSIVDLVNCHVIDYDTTLDQELMNIYTFVYENTYDLIISNSKLCDGKPYKLSFDFDGVAVSGTNTCYSSAFEENSQFPPKIHSIPNGIVMARYNLEENLAEVSLVQSNDSKVLIKYRIDNLLPFGWVPHFSTDDKTIRMCTWLNTEMTCYTFDPSGKLILKNKLDIGYYILYLAIHNLSTGGYILMTAGCSDVDYVFKCRGVEDNYNLIKFDADGTTVGSLNISELKCLAVNEKLEVQLFENENKECCISFACYSESKSPYVAKLKFTSKCFLNSEFAN